MGYEALVDVAGNFLTNAGGGHSSWDHLPYIESTYDGRAASSQISTADYLNLLQDIQNSLATAAQEKNVCYLRQLVQGFIERSDVSTLDNLNAVHWAAYSGDFDLTYELLNCGCNVFLEDNFNQETPIYFAIKGAKIEIVKLIFDFAGHGALTHKNRFQMTPFLSAAANFPEDKIKDMLNIMEWLYLQGISLEEQDGKGQTSLFWSAKRGSINLVQWLLSHGANMNHRDFDGNTVLHAACSNGDDETILFLCQHGAINLVDAASIDDPGIFGGTPFGICLMKRHFLLYLLLQQWSFQHKYFGFVRLFRTPYASYYWICSFLNLVLYFNMAQSLTQKHIMYSWHCASWLLLWTTTQCLWWIAYAYEPGYSSSGVIPSQFERVSADVENDVRARAVLVYPFGSELHKFQELEREQLKINLLIMELRKAFNFIGTGSDNHQLYQEKLHQLSLVQSEMASMALSVALKRRALLPSDYVKAILEPDGEIERACVTCRIVRPVRVHHCAECARCIRKEDHHCLWIDNCVGLQNQRCFWLFLLFLVLTILWNYILAFMYFGSFASTADQMLWVFATFLFGVLFNFTWLGFVGYLLIRTTRSMLTNVTFYEFLKRPEHINRRFSGSFDGIFWDFADLSLIKILRNIYAFWSLSDEVDDVYSRDSVKTNSGGFRNNIFVKPGHRSPSNGYVEMMNYSARSNTGEVPVCVPDLLQFDEDVYTELQG